MQAPTCVRLFRGGRNGPDPASPAYPMSFAARHRQPISVAEGSPRGATPRNKLDRLAAVVTLLVALCMSAPALADSAWAPARRRLEDAPCDSTATRWGCRRRVYSSAHTSLVRTNAAAVFAGNGQALVIGIATSQTSPVITCPAKCSPPRTGRSCGGVPTCSCGRLIERERGPRRRWPYAARPDALGDVSGGRVPILRVRRPLRRNGRRFRDRAGSPR